MRIHAVNAAVKSSKFFLRLELTWRRARSLTHGLDDSEYDAMSGEAPGGKQEASPGTADYRGSGKNGLPTFDELQRGAAKEMAARQSLEDDDYLPNLKNEL